MAIGLMNAMQEENSKLVAELGGDRRVIETGVRSSHVGTLRGIPVAVVFSQWGKVAAATTATCLIAEFNVGEIIFTGVAGGAAPKVQREGRAAAPSAPHGEERKVRRGRLLEHCGAARVAGV